VGVKVKKLPGLDDAKSDALAEKFAKNVGLGFLQDVDIWKNKARVDNPCSARKTDRCTSCAGVRAVLRRCGPGQRGHDPALRVRGGHQPRRGRMEVEVADNVAHQRTIQADA